MPAYETISTLNGRIGKESMSLHCHGTNMSVVSIAPTPAGERVAVYADWEYERFVELPVIGFGIVRETSPGPDDQPRWLNDRQAAHPLVMDPSTGMVFPFAEHHRIGDLVSVVGVFLTADRQGIENAKHEKAKTHGCGWVEQG
ncbi:hypothetical protein ACWGI0_08285 [Streptomyces sp. NPDC054802]